MTSCVDSNKINSSAGLEKNIPNHNVGTAPHGSTSGTCPLPGVYVCLDIHFYTTFPCP